MDKYPEKVWRNTSDEEKSKFYETVTTTNRAIATMMDPTILRASNTSQGKKKPIRSYGSRLYNF
jgi:hypothetical protein